MNPALLLLLGQLLQTAGPLFAQEVAAVKAAKAASAGTQAQLDLQVETMDQKRMADWASADTALDKAAGQA